MKKILIYSLIISAVTLSSCARKTLFNTDVRNRITANNIPLTQLQYYVDRDVELKRVLSSSETKVSSGAVVTENGKQVHIIKLKKGTPGVCTQVAADRISVSFEEGNNKNLVFAFPRGGTSKNAYVLAPLSVDKNNFGTVSYNGTTYYVMPDGVRAKLKIKRSSDTKVKVKKSTMKGRKV